MTYRCRAARVDYIYKQLYSYEYIILCMYSVYPIPHVSHDKDKIGEMIKLLVCRSRVHEC